MSVVIDGTLGITSPAETVQGALTTTGNTILGDSSADTLNVGNGGLVKDASGNVGIGTSNPAPYGKAVIVLGAAGGNALSLQKDTGAGIAFYGTSFNNTGAIDSSNATGAMSFYTGTSGVANQAVITAAGLLQFNSGYGSVATAYGCRAWVNFDGSLASPITPRASGNVSSVTKTGTAQYGVNFTTSMVDANYSLIGTAGDSANGDRTVQGYTNTTSVGTFLVVRGSNGTQAYSTLTCVAVFR